MIVSADFPDHWKTLMLIGMTDATAGFCVLRFWAHCQNRRSWRFENMTPQVLSAVCRWTGDPQIFWNAMTQTFIDIEGTEVVAHQWDEYNSSLIAAWDRGKYGSLGGRKPKAARKRVITSKVSSMAPLEEPDKSREEKMRVEGIGEEQNREEEKPPPIPAKASPSRFEQIVSGYVTAWELRFASKYAFDGSKDGKAVKEIASGPLAVEEIVLRARAAWDGKDQFQRTQAASIHGLRGVLNQIVGAKNGANGNPKPNHNHTPGTDITESW